MIKQFSALLITASLLACSKQATDETTVTPKEISYVVTTYAGKEQTGKTDGKLTEALFDNPVGLAVDSKDNLYIAESGNYAVRVISPSGVVSTINSKTSPFDSAPHRVHVGADDEVVISTIYPRNGWLCKTYSEKNGLKDFVVDPKAIDVMRTGTVFKSTKGDYFFFNSSSLSKLSPSLVLDQNWMEDVEAAATQLDGNIVSVDKNDNFYMLSGFFESAFDGQIKIISPDKSIKFLKGDSFVNNPKVYNYGDGSLPKAHIGIVSGLCVDKAGIIYFIEHDLGLGHRIRKIDLDKKITTIAGGLTDGYKDGDGKDALFGYPSGIAVDSKGNIFVSDYNRIRKISVK